MVEQLEKKVARNGTRIFDERHPERTRDIGELDAIRRRIRERHAALVVAKTLGFQRPSGDALELGRGDARRAEDHAISTTCVSLNISCTT